MYFFIVALIVFLVDQFIKYRIISSLEPFQSIPVIDNIFHITYVQNKGAAFGILPNKTIFFVIVTILVIIFIIFFYIATKNRMDYRLLHFSLALQLGGAMGNLVDRIRFGYVVDFLDFRIWPVFNVADSAIVIGVILLAWILIRAS